MSEIHTYASVILPLAVPKQYSYRVPREMVQDMRFGIRVEVPLRNKLYSAIVVKLSEEAPHGYKARDIISSIDKHPIITKTQLDFWYWLSSYYCCSIGEVMNVALPAGLKLNSETKLILNQDFQFDIHELNDQEYILTEALEIQHELSIGEAKDILNRKSIYPIIRSLLDLGAITVREELVQRFKPKLESYINLTEYYNEDKNRLIEALEKTKRSDGQTRAILAYQKLAKEYPWVIKKVIYDLADVNSSHVSGLIKKEIFIEKKFEVSRIAADKMELSPIPSLSKEQQRAVQQIEHSFDENKHVLLHGVTGSGKTRVYIELIKKALSEDKQSLFLLPEIALATQIVKRIIQVFGDEVGVFHSKINANQRVELWRAALEGKKIILGARSSIFLPFSNLGLIIVDEEHDPSYKQNDPAPRYNGRDASIYLAGLTGAHVIMGTATPAVESYSNTLNDKYSLVEMHERYGNVALPEVQLVDLKHQYKTNRIKDHFSSDLVEAMEQALAKKEQILIFQNRRGYVPTISCPVCAWNSECMNCDVTLTKHMHFQEMRCHYCNYRSKIPKTCPACGSDQLTEKGIGTEKIEDIIEELFQGVSVGRLDFDTAKTKNQYEQILSDFEHQKIQILVGTQMITKGLDFDNIAVVGILNADLLLQFPDFRAHERTYQLLTQVAGRAGRRQKQGKVIIQTFQPDHPVILDIVDNNYQRLFERELIERKQFIYPPYYRMIRLTLKHKQAKVVAEAAQVLAHELKKQLGNRIIGPAEPGISRIRNQYIQTITIKMERNLKKITEIKKLILDLRSELRNANGLKAVRVNIDVDPQ